MMVINKRTVGQRSFKSDDNSAAVVWWKLYIGRAGLIDKKSVKNFEISRHLLNLRPNLPTGQSESKTSSTEPVVTKKRSRSRVSATDFLSPGPQMPWQPAASLRYKYPWLDELSVFFLLEIVLALTYWPVKVVALFYYWMYRHLVVVWQDILDDLVYYFELNYKIFRRFLPWNWFGKRRSNVMFVVPGWRQIAVLLIISTLLILPLKMISLRQNLDGQKDKFISYAQAALVQFTHATDALQSGEFDSAAAGFSEVSKIMQRTEIELQNLSQQLGSVLVSLPGPQQQLSAATLLVQAGKYISDSGTIISEALASLEEAPTSAVTEVNLSLKVLLLQRALVETAPKIDLASQHIEEALEYNLPDSVYLQVFALSNVLIQLQDALQQVAEVPNVLSQIIPATGERRYLLVFQNYSELRPTGGFMGSLAIVQTKDGVISNIEIPGGGPYDFQGQLAVKVNPPEPMRLVNSLWQLQDSNWFFDWPTSAQKIAWFIKQSGGPEFDGVIAINPDLVLSLLKLLGPIELPEYGKTLTDENFLRETQEAVELEYDRAQNRPKQFIADLAPIMIERVFGLEVSNQIEVLALLSQSLQRKSIQVFFTNPELEQQVVQAGWGGEVKQTDGDFLAVVRTNIGGGKSDLVITDKIRHTATLLPSGDIVDKVELTRTHHGDPFDIFYSRRNVSWLKFFVPAGSNLIESNGFETLPAEVFKPADPLAVADEDLKVHEKILDNGEMAGMQISSESGKTVFAGWQTLSPGQSKTVSLVYRLPFKLNRTSKIQDLRKYDLFLSKQSGVNNVDLVSSLILPTGWRVRWQEGTGNMLITGNGLNLVSNWETDQSYGTVIEAPLNYLTNQ